MCCPVAPWRRGSTSAARQSPATQGRTCPTACCSSALNAYMTTYTQSRTWSPRRADTLQHRCGVSFRSIPPVSIAVWLVSYSTTPSPRVRPLSSSSSRPRQLRPFCSLPSASPNLLTPGGRRRCLKGPNHASGSCCAPSHQSLEEYPPWRRRQRPGARVCPR